MKQNSTSMSKGIDEILSIMYVGFHNEEVNTSGIFDPSISFTVYDAKEAIYDLILSEVIGKGATSDWTEEDDFTSKFCRQCDFMPDNEYDKCECSIKNELRAEQRQKLAQLFVRER